MTAPPLVSLRNVDANLGGVTVLRDVSWEVRPGERWLVAGPNGCGKSTLLRLASGKLWPAPGRHDRRWFNFAGAPTWSPVDARGRVALLDPTMQNRYLAQDWNLAAGEVMATGFADTDLLHQSLGPDQMRELRVVVELLGLGSLFERPFLDLSQGERRKTLIGRALLLKPALLLLDEFAEGLDADGRESLWNLLERLGETAVVLTSHRPLSDKRLAGWSRFTLERKSDAPVAGRRRRGSPVADAGGDAPVARSNVIRAEGDFFAGEQLLVSGMNWLIRAGERWLLSGPNGAGKTSLLRLLWGEMHLAAGGVIEHFGQRRTVQEIRPITGFFQPDQHAWVEPSDSVHEVILSGWFATIGLIDPVTDEHEEGALRAAEAWDCAEWLGRPFGQLSYGQQRRALLARATVRGPRLLLLDEPFDGLDAEARADAIVRVAAPPGHVALVMTSHYDEDAREVATHEATIVNRELRCAALRCPSPA